MRLSNVLKNYGSNLRMVNSRALITGYLFGLLLIAFFIGYVLGNFGGIQQPFGETLESNELLFICIFLIALYIQLVQRKVSDISKINISTPNKISFTSINIDINDIAFLKVRKTMFHDIYSVTVKLLDNRVFRYVCTTQDINRLERNYANVIDKRTWFFWPLYAIYILSFIIMGFIFGSNII